MVQSLVMEAAVADTKIAAMRDAVRCILSALGEDVNREGLRDTPKRVAKAYLAMTEGYRQDSAKLLNQAMFNEPIVQQGSGGLVLVQDIDFASFSSHNLLPFYGRAHIAYVPSNGVVLGLSKLARLTKLCAKQLQDAGSLAIQILHVLQTQLAPQGALVVLQARHLSYTEPLLPVQQYTAAASGCLGLAGSCRACGADAACLQEALDLLGLPVELESVRLVSDAADAHALLQSCCRCSSSSSTSAFDSRVQSTGSQNCCRCGGSSRRLEPSILRGFSASAAAAALSSGGLNSPPAPVTPDPSENDDTDNSEQGMLDTCDDLCCQQQLGHISAADVEPASSWLQLRAVGLVVDGRNRSMEAALQLLLSECGVNVASATIQAAIRRHVLALLAATSGCHQEQPSRPFSSSSSHLQQLEQQKMEQPHSAAAASVAGNCRISGGQRLHGQCISVSGNSSSSSRLLQLQPQPLGQHHEHPCNQYDIFEHHVVFISQCEHHMLPFHGTVHFAYLLPRSSSCSSGCPRAPASCCSSNNRTQQQPLSAAEALQLVSCYTKRLQVQERITAQVAEAVQRLLQPLGVMVVVSAVHMCMVARGVENHAGSTSTRAALGLFENDPQLRCQVLKQLRCQSAATRPGQEAAM